MSAAAINRRVIEFPKFSYASKLLRFKLPQPATKNSIRVSLYYNNDKTPRYDFFLENEYKLRRPMYIQIVSLNEFLAIIPVHSLAARIEIMAVGGMSLDEIKVTVEE